MKWLSENVAAVAQVFNGKTPSRDEQRAAGHAVLKIKDVDEFGCFRGTFSGFVDHALAEKHRKKQILGGETLVLNAAHSASHVASKTFFAANAVVGAIATGEWLVVRWDKSKVDERYGNHWINSTDTRFKLRQLINGIHLYPRDVGGLEIPLPPLPEQKRIAGILDAADALRAKRREALAQLDTLLQSTFLDMFGDPVTNPNGWEEKVLGEICDVRDGTHDSPRYVESGHPLLTSKNFKDGEIDLEASNLISDEDFTQINKRSKVDVGDLVMPMIGTIGNPVLVEHEPHFAIKNVALIKFAKGSPDNRFIRALLCSHYFDHITLKANRGGTQKFVALKDLRGMPIPIPRADLQRRFATVVESVERQKARIRAHLAELDALFASLQSRAFNGTL